MESILVSDYLKDEVYPKSSSKVLRTLGPKVERILNNPCPYLGFHPCEPFGHKVPVWDIGAHYYDVMPKQGMRILSTPRIQTQHRTLLCYFFEYPFRNNSKRFTWA